MPADEFIVAETVLSDALKTHEMNTPGMPPMCPTTSSTKRGTILSALLTICEVAQKKVESLRRVVMKFLSF